MGTKVLRVKTTNKQTVGTTARLILSGTREIDSQPVLLVLLVLLFSTLKAKVLKHLRGLVLGHHVDIAEDLLALPPCLHRLALLPELELEGTGRGSLLRHREGVGHISHRHRVGREIAPHPNRLLVPWLVRFITYDVGSLLRRHGTSKIFSHFCTKKLIGTIHKLRQHQFSIYLTP